MSELQESIYPPKWADWFLEWYCIPERLEEIQGDAHELYRIRTEEEGRGAAKRKFVWDVLRFFKWSNINKSQYKNYNMGIISNYFKVGIRNINKNRLTSAINITGLSLAIGFALVCYIFLDFSYRADHYHVRHNRIFMVEAIINRDGQEDLWGDSPNAIGPTMASDFEQVEMFTRVEFGRAIMKYEDNVFSQRLWFADPDFLRIFSFKLKWGRVNALDNPKNVVLSDAVAQKFFGDDNPIGKQVSLTFLDNEGREVQQSFFVGGVAEKFNRKRSFAFSVLVHYDFQDQLGLENLDADWKEFTTGTFILAEKPENSQPLQAGMSRYLSIQNEANPEWRTQQFLLEPLTTLARNGWRIRNSISGAGHIGGRIFLIAISIFLLALACFNYMNIALSAAARRVKEIGIRKTVGGRRNQLIFQFLSENLLFCFMALAAGILIARFIIIPVFDSMIPIEFSLDFNDAGIWMFFVLITLVTALAGGAYPAFYISRFQPSQIFRGNRHFGKSNRFSSVILTFQYVLALLTIGLSIALIQNSEYLQNKDWGYGEDHVIVVPANDRFQEFSDAVNDHTSIISYAGAINTVGFSSPLRVINHNEEKVEVTRLMVGHNYLETMQIRLEDGRLFHEDITSDSIEAVVINQTFVRRLDLEDPIGFAFKMEDKNYYVIGVVEDFHYQIPFVEIRPAVIMNVPQEQLTQFACRVKEGQLESTMAYFQETWKRIEPDLPFEGRYQEEALESFMREMRGEKKLAWIIGSFALIISCVGLFGMTSLSISRRLKEFSIRKVMGANASEVSNLVTRNILIILIISSIIATPLAYLSVKAMFDGIFVYHVPLTWLPFGLAIFAISLTSFLTVSSKLYQVAVVNPVDNLRNE